MPLSVKPWTMKQAKPWIRRVHRRLKKLQGGLFAIAVRDEHDLVVGCAVVGHAARELMNEDILAVLRVAVLEGQPNACSMLYGACSRAARAMGAEDLVTYTHLDEHGASLRAANWIHGGETDGGEHSRPSRQRALAIDPLPKNRWWAPWGKRARAIRELEAA